MEQEADSPRCDVCGEPLEGRPVVHCVACATPHHAECWQWMGWCSVYGCGCRVARPGLCAEAAEDDSVVLRIPFPDGAAAASSPPSLPSSPPIPLPQPRGHRFADRVAGALRDMLGRLLAPAPPLVDLHSSIPRTALGFALLPLWLLVYGMVLAVAAPLALVNALLEELLADAEVPPDPGPATGRDRQRRQARPAPGLLRTDGPLVLPGRGLADLAFLDADRGLLVMDDGSVWTSDDGGATWTPRPSPPAAGLAVGPDGGLWLARRDGGLMVSSDGGAVWASPGGRRAIGVVVGLDEPTPYRAAPTEEVPARVVDLAPLSADRAMALLQAGHGVPILASTEDGGATWEAVSRSGGRPAPLPGRPLCVSFLDETRGWLGGRTGRVFATTDGGRHWEREAWYLPEPVISLWVGSSGVGVALGTDGSCWVRGKDGWRATDPVLGRAVPLRVRAVAPAGVERLAVATSAGLVFLRWTEGPVA